MQHVHSIQGVSMHSSRQFIFSPSLYANEALPRAHSELDVVGQREVRCPHYRHVEKENQKIKALLSVRFS